MHEFDNVKSVLIIKKQISLSHQNPIINTGVLTVACIRNILCVHLFVYLKYMYLKHKTSCAFTNQIYFLSIMKNEMYRTKLIADDK